jgi:hypothetical protein
MHCAYIATTEHTCLLHAIEYANTVPETYQHERGELLIDYLRLTYFLPL